MNTGCKKNITKQYISLIYIIVFTTLLLFSLYIDNVKISDYKGFSMVGESDIYKFDVFYCKNCHKFNVSVVYKENNVMPIHLSFTDYQNKVGAKIIKTEDTHKLLVIGDYSDHALLRVYNIESATLDDQKDLPMKYSVAYKMHVSCIVVDVVLAVLICVFTFMWFKKNNKFSKKQGDET